MKKTPDIYVYRQVVQAKLFMDSHYGEPIELDQIANEAFFSKFHFLRLFKRMNGKTPHQYLIAVRIRKAKELLQTEMSVTQVCLSVGFDSLSSFIGLFKKQTAMTPAVYQKIQLQRKKEISERPLKFVPNCFAENKGWNKESNFEEV